VTQGPDPAKRLLDVAEARSLMLAGIKILGSEQVPLDAALGRILAHPVIAARDQPPFAASAMDGYAVRSADTPGLLTVIGESAAGHGFAGPCKAGTAVRISTGAALPEGADSIVIQEDVRHDGDRIQVPQVAAGHFIRRRGIDFTAGAGLLDKGCVLDGVGISLAAASGAAALPVARRPRVAILSSGDELAAPGEAPGPWQIFDSATYGLAGLIASWGGDAKRLAVAKDDVAAIAQAAEEALANSDLLLLVGGASVGDHDHARPALLRLGLEMKVGKVAVRPGKPTWFGITQHGPVLGLPGNPASAMVCAHLFLKPLLLAMQGRRSEPRFLRAHLAKALPANGAREHYLRSALKPDDQGRLTVHAFEDQDSSLISIFAAANALIRLAPDAPAQNEGALMDVLPLFDVLHMGERPC
jgi:molybdopterin molybdotransferase